MFIKTPALILAAALGLSACSSTGKVSVQVSGDYGSEPVVAITPGDPVTELESTDVIVGTGDAVPAGASVTADYVGYGANTGQMFDASWLRGEPATFPLAKVILGWQEGLVGMQVGGRRLLVIPAAQGYGDNPPPGIGIEPGETLIFVVDLVGFE
jgi:peptidylprolyl isomerase